MSCRIQTTPDRDHGFTSRTSTIESKTRTFFQFFWFSSMNCLWRGASWYLSWAALLANVMWSATSKSRSFTGRSSSAARTPTEKESAPSWPVRYFLQAATSAARAAGEASFRLKKTSWESA